MLFGDSCGRSGMGGKEVQIELMGAHGRTAAGQRSPRDSGRPPARFCTPSEGGESTVGGETRIQSALDAVTSPHTFGRWDENAGTLHTFRRWDDETGKVCNDGRNLMRNAVHEGCCERYDWNTILQWHIIAGSATAVEDKRKGSRKERKEDGKRLYGECG